MMYHALAAAFQVALAVLILTAGRPDALRAAVATILGLNALETIDAFLLDVGATQLPAGLVFAVIDATILWTVCYVLTQVPAPLGGPRGRRILTWAWALSPALLALAAILSGHTFGTPTGPAPRLVEALHQAPFSIAPALLALHVIPQWRRLPEGPLRAQTTLIAAGLSIGMAYIIAPPVLRPFPLPFLTTGYYVGLFFLGAAALRAYFPRADGATRGAALVAGMIALGAAVGLFELHVVQPRLVAGGAPPIGEFLVQSFRPFFIALAVLRFEMFRLPRGVRRPIGTAAVVFFGMSLFTLLAVVLAASPLAVTALPAPSVTLATAILLVALVVTRHPVARTVDRLLSPEPGDDDLQRLERYRLALERERAMPGGADTRALARLRRAWGVTLEEHRALETVVARHVVLPTAAIRGAAPGAVIGMRYHVLRVLGQGGFGRALMAHDAATGGQVVLKELVHPWEDGAERRLRSLEREIEVGRLLPPRHFARVHTLLHDGYNHYLVREFVPGETLEERVKRAGPLPAYDARLLGLALLDALADLHAQGLLFLDLKPANVVLRPDGTPVLIDFGTIRRLAGTSEGAAVTKTAGGGNPGTLLWMAPEQVIGHHIDARTDLFAVGAVLHYALSGTTHVPADAPTAFAVEEALVRGPSLPLPDHVPPALAALVDRALAREPAARWPDVRTMRLALGRLTGTPAAPVPVLERGDGHGE